MKLANLLRGFGPTSGGSPPATPTFTVSDNGNGTGGVATISGSDSGATNTVYYTRWTGTVGELDWTAAGHRTGDGTVAVNVGTGPFLLIVISDNGSGISWTELVFADFTNPNGTPLGEDAETMTAFIALWLLTPGLVSLVPGGIHADKLVAPAGTPYARIECKQGPKPTIDCGGLRFIDYRDVSINIWGVGAVNVSAIVPALHKPFSNGTIWFEDGAVSLVRIEPISISVFEEEKTKSGEDYRAIKARWCVWTDRQYVLTPMVITGTLPDGTSSVAYSATLSGRPRWIWSATGLPTGLSINAATGNVHGTPTTPGTFAVAITATDSQGNTGTHSQNIVIS